MSDLFASSVAGLTAPVTDPLAAQLGQQVRSALARFSTERRLFNLQGEGPVKELLVEAWSAHEALSELTVTRILCLSSNAGLSLDSLLGQPVRLQSALADGTRSTRSGLIASA